MNRNKSQNSSETDPFEHGLRKAIRTDNGASFAPSATGGLSRPAAAFYEIDTTTFAVKTKVNDEKWVVLFDLYSRCPLAVVPQSHMKTLNKGLRGVVERLWTLQRAKGVQHASRPDT